MGKGNRNRLDRAEAATEPKKPIRQQGYTFETEPLKQMLCLHILLGNYSIKLVHIQMFASIRNKHPQYLGCNSPPPILRK